MQRLHVRKILSWIALAVVWVGGCAAVSSRDQWSYQLGEAVGRSSAIKIRNAGVPVETACQTVLLDEKEPPPLGEDQTNHKIVDSDFMDGCENFLKTHG